MQISQGVPHDRLETKDVDPDGTPQRDGRAIQRMLFAVVKWIREQV